MSVFIETWKGLRGFSSANELTKKGKAFAENQRTGECFEEADLQALISQLWSILTGHFADQVTHKWNACEWERNKWVTSIIEAKHKWPWSVPDEMQVPAECLASARRRLAADLRVIFTVTIW